VPQRWLERPVLEAVQKVKDIAEQQAGLSLAQFALAWVLRRAEVSSAIVGVTGIKQLSENAAAADKAVAPELFEKAEEILTPVL
jgi:1-deoxyxylulose-5-phosphate synthase